MKRIESRENPRYKQLRKLAHNSRERHAAGLTVLDGAHLIVAWLEAGWLPESVWLSEAATGRDELQRVMTAATQRGVELVLLPDVLFAQASPVDSPSGVLALIKPHTLHAKALGNWLLLDRVQDPGNLGGLLRTAAAAGIKRALLSAGCASAWSPKVLRAGMGAHCVLAIEEQVDLLDALADFPGIVVATGLRDDCVDHFDVDLRQQVAWLFGAEGQGLSNELFERADSVVKIRMHSGVESLNVAAAAAVCLFEQRRQLVQC